jgi:hypothetical protein
MPAAAALLVKLFIMAMDALSEGAARKVGELGGNPSGMKLLQAGQHAWCMHSMCQDQCKWHRSQC